MQSKTASAFEKFSSAVYLRQYRSSFAIIGKRSRDQVSCTDKRGNQLLVQKETKKAVKACICLLIHYGRSSENNQ